MPSENNIETGRPTPKSRPAAAAQIKVRVVKQAVNEGGKHYFKGDVIEVDADRAEALGDLVVPHQA